MRDQLSKLAKPLFRPSTSIFDVGVYLSFDAMLDLEPAEPVLHVGSGKQWAPRAPTNEELAAILVGLQASPPKPPMLTPLEVIARFTDAEQDLIDTHAKRLARRLFAAIEPVSWATFAASVAELRTAELITAEQAERILA